MWDTAVYFTEKTNSNCECTKVMKLKKAIQKTAAGFLAVLLGMALSGCGGKKNDEPVSSPAEVIEMTGFTVGISLPSDLEMRWLREGEALKDQFVSHGYETELLYGGGKASDQADDIQTLLSKGCDLLIIAPVSGLTADALSDTEIPVITMGQLIPNGTAVDYFIGVDNYQAGYLEGKFITDSIGLKLNRTEKSCNVEFLAGDQADSRSGYYFNGAYDALDPFMRAGIVKVPSGKETFTESMISGNDPEAVKTYLKEIFDSAYRDGTKLDAVICPGSALSHAASEALSSYRGEGKPYVTGIADGDVSFADLVDGRLSCGIFYPYMQETTIAYDLAREILRGEAPDRDLVEKSKWKFTAAYDTESMYDGQRVIPSYLITPTVLTNDNLESVLVEQGYAEMNGKYPKLKEVELPEE